MDDSKLRALLTAVQCGSFGKAAVQLGYTQSAMTHLVSKLEAELGCTLLLRSSKGVCLSEEGEHLLPYIHGVINACDALRQEAEEQGEVYGRALRIGCFASIARASLPELLRKFRKLHPEIKVDVLVQGSELAAALEEDRIQLAIVDENCARGFQWTPLTDAPLVAVTPKDFPWTESTISLARLLQEPFLSCPEQYVEQYLPADTPRLEVAASDDGAHFVHGSRRTGRVGAVRLLSGGVREPGAGHPAGPAPVPPFGRGGEVHARSQLAGTAVPGLPEASVPDRSSGEISKKEPYPKGYGSFLLSRSVQRRRYGVGRDGTGVASGSALPELRLGLLQQLRLLDEVNGRGAQHLACMDGGRWASGVLLQDTTCQLWQGTWLGHTAIWIWAVGHW